MYKNLLEKKPDYLVCVCMGIMYTDIIAAIERGTSSFEDLQKELLVGTGCSSCHEEVRQIFLTIK
jgi:bacterioferritin-associated ferredoxin